MSADIFAPLEAKLSPNGKRAYEAYVTAFWREGQEATVGEIRAAVKLIYGQEVDRELEAHIEDRCRAVTAASLRTNEGGAK